MVSILRGEVPQAREAQLRPRRPWERTGSVDVEVLAQWSYAVQMVDRFERTGLHQIEAEAAGYEVSRYSRDGVGQLMAIEHLGCRIDRCGGLVSDLVHPAALALASELRGVEHGDRVRVYAIAGTRPGGWKAPVVKVRPAQWANDGQQAVIEYQGPGRKGAYCLVVIDWDNRLETWGRGDYHQWWQALCDLQWRLSRRALGFLVTGPAAPAEPWLDPAPAGAPPPPNGSSQTPQR